MILACEGVGRDTESTKGLILYCVLLGRSMRRDIFSELELSFSSEVLVGLLFVRKAFVQCKSRKTDQKSLLTLVGKC